MGSHVLIEGREIAVGTVYSDPVKLRDGLENHALSYAVSGSGTAAVEVEISIDGKYYITAGVVLKGATATSGPSGDGRGYVPLVLYPGEFLRTKVVVTSAAVTLWLWFVQK
jgi:hypothetical protein